MDRHTDQRQTYGQTHISKIDIWTDTQIKDRHMYRHTYQRQTYGQTHRSKIDIWTDTQINDRHMDRHTDQRQTGSDLLQKNKKLCLQGYNNVYTKKKLFAGPKLIICILITGCCLDFRFFFIKIEK